MWSDFAAGLSMGFSLIATGLIGRYLLGVSWAPLLSSFGYTIGFLIVVLGRQQLFTENTLTAIIPLLHERSLKRLLNVLRLWVAVLISNLIGVFVVTWVIANTTIFEPEVKNMFFEIGLKAMQPDFTTVLLSGIFAG